MDYAHCLSDAGYWWCGGVLASVTTHLMGHALATNSKRVEMISLPLVALFDGILAAVAGVVVCVVGLNHREQNIIAGVTILIIVARTE